MKRVVPLGFSVLGGIGTVAAPFAAFLAPQPLQVAPIVPDALIFAFLYGALVVAASAAAWWLGLAFLGGPLFLGLAFIRLSFDSGATPTAREQLILLVAAGVLFAFASVGAALCVRGARFSRAAV